MMAKLIVITGIMLFDGALAVSMVEFRKIEDNTLVTSKALVMNDTSLPPVR